MNKRLAVILLLVIIVPAAIVLIAYRNAMTGAPDAETVESLDLTTPDGISYSFSSETDAEMIGILVNLISGGTKVNSLPLQLDGRHYTMHVSSKPRVTYKLYLTSNPEICYFSDNIRTYKISADVARPFLATSYSACLYATSDVPRLLLSGQVTSPSAADWYYKTYTGAFVRLDETPLLAADVPTFHLEGGLGITFSEEPDSCRVVIAPAEGGEALYDGTLAGMSAFNVGECGTVRVTVSAAWEHKDDISAYGSVSYEFFADVTAPAEFYLTVSDTNQQGDLATITAYNIVSVADISFSSSPDLGVSPVFYQVPGKAYCGALLPIPYNAAVGTYTLTLKYAGVSQSLTMKVVKRTVRSSDLVVTQAIYNAHYSPSLIKAFENDVASALTKTAAQPLWSGTFPRVFADDKIKAGFGRERIVYIASKKAGQSFVQTTVTYKVNSGTDVPCTAAGQVVYVGYTEYGGNAVIVDHGMGLKSWYLHLDSCSVKAGDTVGAGDVIGTAGKSGFFTSDYTGLDYAMSVGSVYVCPYDLWDDGELRGIVFYEKAE